MDLIDAFQALQAKVIVLVGGGGKTTTMYRLAREMAGLGARVVVTTTTRISLPSRKEAGATIVCRDIDELCSRVRSTLEAEAIVGVGLDVIEDGKLKGIPPEWVAEIAGLADHVLVEADGAAEKPFKAPADYEPVIPECADLVIAVVGVEAVGLTMVRENVHRPERIQAITGLETGDVVTPAVIAQVLLHPRGITKGAPPTAEIAVLVNKVEDDEKLAAAREIGRLLREGGIRRVVIGRVRNDPPVVETML